MKVKACLFQLIDYIIWIVVEIIYSILYNLDVDI
jgi:hypothetical protein